MSYQLIYTSAPRLLEAGRTGFGTVARHRGVGELAAAAVERVSQFARLPGLSVRRVIYSHRILHVGASTLHVFSCIRDAGSDYTGRTNHLAHHLIADSREARLAAEAGITPADVLMQMKWRATWQETPRFFEPSEEITLSNLRARALGSAWERVTGSASMSVLPAQTPRCFLILPAEGDALSLIHESLKGMSSHAWQVSFTTHLESADDAAEFRWIGITRSSPFRHLADTGTRTVLDLNEPHTLPKPESSVGKTSEVRAQETMRAPDLPMAQASEVMPAFSSLPPALSLERPQGRSRWPLAVGVGIAACALWVVCVLWVPWEKAKHTSSAQTAVSLAQRVDALWQKHHLALSGTATWLKSQSSATLIDSHEAALRQLAQALREPLRPGEITRPESTQDEFMDMLQSFSRWQRAVTDSVRLETWTRASVSDMKIESQVRLATEERLWKSFIKNFDRAPENPNTLKHEISSQVLKRLNLGSAPAGAAEDWRDLAAMILSPPPGWLDAWVVSSRLPPPPALISEGAQKLLRELRADLKAPSWLQQEAGRRLDHSMEMQRTTEAAALATEKALQPTSPVLLIPPADGPVSPHPRFIVIASAERDLNQTLEQLPVLPVQPDLQLWVGGAGFAEVNLVRWKQLGAEGVYRKSFTDAATLEIKEGRLIKAPSTTDSWRILARTATSEKVLFEVLLQAPKIQANEVWHADPAFTFQSQYKDSRTTLESAAAQWLAQISFIGAKPRLRLQSLADAARRLLVRLESGEAVVEIETRQQNLATASPRIAILTEQIDSLKQGIQIDQQSKKDLAESKLSQREKDKALLRAENAIANKEQRILEMEEELRTHAAASAPQGALIGVPAGRYVLLAVSLNPDGSEKTNRLCELTITSQPAKSAP